MAAVQRRGGLVGAQELKVLRAARRQPGGEKVRRAVVDQVAPSVGALEEQALREAAVQLNGQSVIGGVADGRELDDRVGETGGGEGGNDVRPRLDLRESNGKRIQTRLARGSQISGQKQSGSRLGLPVDALLDIQVNPAGSQVTNLQGVVLGEHMLHPEVVLKGMGQLLIRHIAGRVRDGVGP